MIDKVSINTAPAKTVKPSFRAQEQSKAEIPSVQNLKSVEAPTLMAYMTKLYAPSNVEVKFYNAPSVNQMTEKYGLQAKDAAQDLAQRAGKKGQVLNWIGVLPKTQLERLDEIYTLADSMRQKGSEKLAVIGIGGSKHTVENLLTLNGKQNKAHFLSAADPDSIAEFFVKKLGNTDKAAVLVASKSGTTMEPSYDFDVVQQVLGDKFDNYVCITDADESKSKLRQIANEKGYKCGIIHDDCGGRFGAFDDHALTALAYNGMPKEDMKRMLEASLKAQKEFLNPDITKNKALQRAVYNADSVLKGKQNQYDYYFGDRFEGTALWNTQLKKESHKSLYKPSGDLIGPAFLHNSTEADLDSGNTTSFYTFNTIKNDGTKKYKLNNSLIEGSLKAYSDRHPVSVVALKDLSPESIAEYVELKHFETMYTGMILRKLTEKTKGEKQSDVLPEVLQPSVNIYKDEVKKLMNT